MPVKAKLVPTGSIAPDFSLPTASGGEVTLSNYRGKSCVVLVFLREFQ